MRMFQSQETTKGNSGWGAEKCHLFSGFPERCLILLKPRDPYCYAEVASSSCAGSWALDEALCRGGIRRRKEGLGLTLRLIKQEP